MTTTEKINMVKGLVENDPRATDEVVATYLALAEAKIRDRLYPYSNKNYIPPQYEMSECELASRLFLRRGGEGEINHSENGVSRSYGTVDDDDILLRLTPFAGINKDYPVLTYALTFNGQPAVPDAAGNYRAGTKLSFEGEGVIYYTMDGSTPDTNSQTYSSPIVLLSTTPQTSYTIKAVAFDGTFGNMITLSLSVTNI